MKYRTLSVFLNLNDNFQLIIDRFFRAKKTKAALFKKKIVLYTNKSLNLNLPLVSGKLRLSDILF